MDFLLQIDICFIFSISLPQQLMKFILHMKTKKQINHFLRQRNFKSEIDFDFISSYCLKKHNLKLHHPSNFFPDSPQALDCPTFTQWVDTGFGAGDAVKWGENIGLVQTGGIDEVKICLRIDGNGVYFDSFMISVQSIEHADESVLKRIYDVLWENNKEFGNPHYVVTEIAPPLPGSLVKFINRSTQAEGFGVLKNVLDNGEVVMYCYCLGENVKYNMNEHIGFFRDYSFSTFEAKDYLRKKLEAELNKCGKTWNHHVMRIEPVDLQVEKDQTYFYISDQFRVVSATDKKTATPHLRYLAGNYFRNEIDAYKLRDAIIESMRELYAE